MRARKLALTLCLIFTTSTTTAEEKELPPLELFGFIADFSDEEEGWVDPQEIEDLFRLDSADSVDVDKEKRGKALADKDSGMPQENASRE